MKKNILKDLNILCLMLDKNFNINSGYCYYVAYLIAKFLEKNNIEYQFVAFREPWGDKSIIFHYGIKVEDIIINPPSQEIINSIPVEMQYIVQNSKWMYNQFKENYKPKLSEYWKDYNKRYVNCELKYFFQKNNSKF